jgi:peroxiredoxin
VSRRLLSRRALGVAALLLVGVSALIVGVLLSRNHAEDQRAAAALMAVQLPDADGRPQRIDQWRGKVVVVNFWATWCVPCREEMPQFVDAQKRDGARGLQFVGIAVDQADKVRRFADEIGLNYPTLIGGLGAMELSRDLGNRVMALPFTVILDRQGRVVHTQLGVLKPDKLAAVVEPLLAAPAG